MSKGKIALVLIIAAIVVVFIWFDLARFLEFEALKERQAEIDALYQERPLFLLLGYFIVYVAVTGLSLPGAAILTLAGGAIFGLLWGTVVVSFASTTGATIAFLVSRYLLRDAIQKRYGDRLKAINDGIERDGAFYLFTLRLVPVFPFFMVNLVMGITPMRTLTFALVSQAGMLAGTIVYVNAGTRLAQLDSLQGILSPALIGSFVLLGVFPLIAKKIVDIVKSRRAFAGWKKPKRFERDLVVIGAGSAGLVCSYIAAMVKAKVSLIERHRMGGDCLNTGCVPSKALIRSAKLVHQAKHADRYGLEPSSMKVDFAKVMERVQKVIEEIEPHDSVERYTGLGVDCVTGQATITSPWTVEIKPSGDDPGAAARTLTTRNIVIATGARPFVPPIPGIEEVGYLTSDNLWDLRELPDRLIVLGGGPIGSELAQCFARLGSKVTQVEMLPRILIREDPEIAEMVMRRFVEEGIDVRTGHRAKSFSLRDGEKRLLCEHEGEEIDIAFDQVIVAVGRAANVSGFGLETLGIDISERRTVAVNDYLQTRFPNIFACGDVAGPYQFTHVSAHQAWFATVNALFGTFRKFRVDYSVIPWATFTDPEVARVGLNEIEAKERGVEYEVTTYGIDDLDRAIADGEAHGLVKVLTAPGKDRILGVSIVGEHAGDLIAEFVAAMRNGFGLNRILSTIHIYPTLAEANKYAAGEWKRARKPERLLRLIERYHAFRRG
ncbi:MAG: FAD-dependent oxidoreductase [Ectothiorhodospiraceae bacterium AqS1]|nr:FAD-dependent oxidoreductase [Ectothiorhodospiraceae bacterium AqS1]